MKAKLDYYRVFYEVAKSPSFSEAAKSLYISQSAISQCIRQLESDLGVQLFYRTRRGVALTKEGEVLFGKVESAMQSIEQGETLLARLHHLESGSLFIAAGDTITSHYLLPYLEQFHKKYPGIKIEMANSYSSRMLERVKNGEADLAFINLPAKDDELEIVPCMEIHDIFVCSPEYSTKKSYTRKDVSCEPLILLETNSNSRRYIQKQFEFDGIILTPHIEMAAHDLLLRFASINLGVACVVKEFSKEAIDTGLIKEIKLSSPLPPRHIGYAHLRSTPLTGAARAFLDLVTAT